MDLIDKAILEHLVTFLREMLAEVNHGMAFGGATGMPRVDDENNPATARQMV